MNNNNNDSDAEFEALKQRQISFARQHHDKLMIDPMDYTLMSMGNFGLWDEMSGVETVKSENGNKTRIKYKFSMAEGDFSAGHLGIDCFENFPIVVVKNLSLAGDTFASFENFPQFVYGSILFKSAILPNGLKGIANHLSECNEAIEINASVRSHLLGVLKIKNLKRLKSFIPLPANSELAQAIKIINEHLALGKTFNERNAMECQDKLLEAGLKQYAKS